jgi:hypothetical protein
MAFRQKAQNFAIFFPEKWPDFAKKIAKYRLRINSNPWPFRRFTFHELETLEVSSRRR